MATSDLTAQLLLGQATRQRVNPRSAMAQRLMAAGADTSPVASPLAALARALTGGIGGYMAGQAQAEDRADQDRATQQLRDHQAGQEREAADFFAPRPAGAPAVAAPMAGAEPPPGTPAPRPAAVGTEALPPPELMPHFQRASEETGIPVPVLVAQARQESNFRPDAVGRAGEVGVMQIMPSTARQPGFGVPPADPAALRDPGANIRFGAQYLAARAGQGDWNDPQFRAGALRNYNGGGDPNYVQNVERWMPGGGSAPNASPMPATTPQPRQPAEQSPEMQRVIGGMQDPRPHVRAEAQRRLQVLQLQQRQETPGATVRMVGPQGPGVYERQRDGSVRFLGGAIDERPSQTVNLPGPEATYDRERQKSLQERVTTVEESLRTHTGTLRRLDTIERMAQAFETGSLANLRLTGGRIMQLFGVNDDFLRRFGIARDQVASGEALQAATSELLQGMIGPGGFPAANFSNADREMLERALPTIQTSPGGIRVMVQIRRAQAQNDLAIAREWNTWMRQNGDSAASARSFFNERVPELLESTRNGVLEPLLKDFLTPASGPVPQDGSVAIPGAGGATASPPPAPVRVQTPEDARRLPSGTPIILPDGSAGRVP
jgi:soluble lytic murein transglycosylase-like protein